MSRLATRAAFYSELRALLGAVDALVPRAEYRRRVIEDDVLSRRTGSAREKTWKELAALLKLARPEPGPTPPTPPTQRTYEWRPLAEFGGRSFGPHEGKELERQLDQLKERLKQKLADGFTVVIK